MNRLFKKAVGLFAVIYLLGSRVSAQPRLPVAQIPSSLKSNFQYGLGVLFLIGFFWGVINIWGGAEKMKRGDADGKMGIVSGLVIAGAASIMSALFYIFGIGDGALTPTF